MQRQKKVCPITEAGIRFVDYKDDRFLSRFITDYLYTPILRAFPKITFVNSMIALLLAMAIAGPRALVAHLGDSRGYLYREEQLHRLTRDHSLIQALVDAGEVEPEDAREHPSRSVITRHVGMVPPAHPDVSSVKLQPADRLLLCSDGLHGAVDDESLAEILGARRTAGDTCAALITWPGVPAGTA